MSLAAALSDIVEAEGKWRGSPADLLSRVRDAAVFFGWDSDPAWPKDIPSLMCSIGECKDVLARAGVRVDVWSSDDLSVSRIEQKKVESGTIFECPIARMNKSVDDLDLYGPVGHKKLVTQQLLAPKPVAAHNTNKILRAGPAVDKIETEPRSGSKGSGPPSPTIAMFMGKFQPYAVSLEERLSGLTWGECQMVLNPESCTCLTCQYGQKAGGCGHPMGDHRKMVHLSARTIAWTFQIGPFDELTVDCIGWEKISG